MRYVTIVCGLALAALPVAPAAAMDPPVGSCQRYQVALSTVDNVPRDALRSREALPCLIKALSDLRPSVTSVEAAAARREVVRAARALRVILEDRKADAIDDFRRADDLGSITVLTFGARSEDYDTRLNTTLVLGSVIDDTTVCVPIDHLYDPKISAPGRANLLAIVSSAVGSMAVEDLGEVEKVSAFTRSALPRNSPDSLRILDNLDAKVADRRDKVRARGDGQSNSRTASCRAYRVVWAAPKMTIYTQIGSDAAAERAKYDALKRALPGDAYVVPAVENVRRAIVRNEVRYCNPDNKDEAQALSELLASKGVATLTVVEIGKCDAEKNRNVLEVWFQGGA